MDEILEPFIIEEIGVANPVRVLLADEDLPFGRARDFAAFESGGEIRLGNDDGVRLPGGRVVFHVMYAKERPLILKGAFRDSLLGSDGHARRYRDNVDLIRKRANLVRVTWASESRTGLLQDAKFGEEDEHNITYELKFIISDGAGTSPPASDEMSLPDVSPLALIAQMIADFAMIKAIDVSVAVASQVALTVKALEYACEQRMNDTATYVASLDAPQDTSQAALREAAQRCQSSASQAQTSIAALSTYISGLTLATAISSPSPSADDAIAFATYQNTSRTTCDSALDTFRVISIKAATLAGTSTRLYQIQTGDTLESIAQSQLGSRGRASEIMLPGPAPVAGSWIGIPGA